MKPNKKNKGPAGGHHSDCTNWDYETHPNHRLLGARCDAEVERFKALSLADPIVTDLRPSHRSLYHDMAPRSCSCFAGNYRGESSCPQLRNYWAGIRDSKPRVGFDADKVVSAMQQFKLDAARDFEEFEKQRRTSSDPNSDVLLGYFAAILAIRLQQFLTIHPFANGNGHASRLFIAAQLIRYGFWHGNWPVEARPQYSVDIHMHRQGYPDRLISLMGMVMAGMFVPLDSSQ